MNGIYSTDWVQLAKDCRAAAAQAIMDCKRSDPNGHYTHRGVEVLSIDDKGERFDCDPLDYLEVKQISGKQLRTIAEHATPGWTSIAIQGGVDGYDSYKNAMQYPDDYIPWVASWDIDSDEIPGNGKVSQDESAKRENVSTRATSQPYVKGMYAQE